MVKKQAFHVVLQEEDVGFSVTCPVLPGCISQGDTKKEALENIKEAIECYLESLKKHKELPPALQDVVVEVSV
ncbi:MAG: type II toxin-antitoxin system HicB family antitoxin [Nanoarchaeota archaeon]|nr:type II toxin-antitoxin system HicB family antitoxin [Nanoarchaeota archaeon]